MKNKVFKVILELLPLLFLIGLAAALGYSIFYSQKLEDQISERDKTIRELSFRSELVEEYFDYGIMPDDSTKMYYTLKESKIPKRVVKETEYEYVDRLIEREKIVDKTPKIIAGDTTINIGELINRYNSISDTNYRIRQENQQLRAALSLIEKTYSITYDVSVDSNLIITTLKNTEKVDSSLMLLPYYRDRLEKDKDGTWMIKTRSRWFGL